MLYSCFSRFKGNNIWRKKKKKKKEEKKKENEKVDLFFEKEFCWIPKVATKILRLDLRSYPSNCELVKITIISQTVLSVALLLHPVDLYNEGILLRCFIYLLFNWANYWMDLESVAAVFQIKSARSLYSGGGRKIDQFL